jgi:hypothetical protein
VQIRRTGLTFLATAALALAGSGCGGSDQGRPSVVAAPGVTVSVLQYRSDYTLRRLQLQVTNDGPAPIKVTAARVNSTAFDGLTSWQSRDQADETTIAPGTSVDLPAALPASICRTAADFVTAQLSLRSADGTVGATARLPVQDKFGTITKVHTEDCRREAALGIAELTLVDPLRRTTRKGRPIAQLDLRLTPTGKPGTLTVESIGSTTLLGPPTGAAWPVNRTVSADSGPQTVTLELRAARCDPHAIAEDKLGTVLPLTLRVDDGQSGVVPVAAAADLRIQIQRFVHDACAAG